MAKYQLLKLRRLQAEAEPVTEVNIIPVIDISLVLLVILFVTAPLLSYPNHPVILPKASLPPVEDQSLVVTYTKDGRIALRAVDVGWDRLEPALKVELSKSPSVVVLLRVDESVPYKIVQRLLAAAKRAGAREIAMATEPAKK
ncbi:MAG: biopolymer transporter ExbD [Elusimicrobia bacterium]|nr:biopolymer transporter ExbD [Elusimicrobiota bacterium]